MYLVGSLGFIFLLYVTWYKSVGASITAVLGIIASSIAFYRFIGKAREREKLFINKSMLLIIYSNYFDRKDYAYKLADISELKFIGKDKLSHTH